MTRRGRATLAALAGACGAALLWLVSLPAPPATVAAGGPPVEIASVSAPGAATRVPEPPREIFERLPVAEGELAQFEEAADREALRVEYTLNPELTRRVFRVLRRGRVELGHVIVLDPNRGRLLVYASTDVARFPPTRAYPAASLVKVITAAAALTRDPRLAARPCRYRGNPYRLTPASIDPPKRGPTISLRRALATSNNQCFAQLAVHAVGRDALLEAITRFGWLSAPAPAHAAGVVDALSDRYQVGRLGSGLAGGWITPLHAAQLAATLARGELIAPRWIERVVDGRGRELPLPPVPARRQVLSPEVAAQLRGMLVDTTVSGTARSAFRASDGRPLLGPVTVAGKTGSLSGVEPDGRYEWFVGIAPAERPRIAVAVLLVQGDLWWKNAAQIGAEVLQAAFCSEGECSAAAAARWKRPEGARLASAAGASLR
ncbi:MAG: penicillin-binding transpeptidase domain-containing protein [Myxococcota bacterium]